jgi:mitochondrial import inner membrane translocase subunit TIM50
VHSNWTHKHGWRFQKRPGLDIFLSQIGYPNFEVVIWTVENGMTFFPIINGMDPQGQYIMYRLFRDATHYINGHHCKDLSRLNRDLKKVIVIDWNRETIQVKMIE